MVFAVGGCLWAAGAAFGGAPAGLTARTGSLRSAVMSADGVSRREMMQSGSAAAAAAAAAGSFLPQVASAKQGGPVTGWQTVDLPIATESPILFDIDFDPQNPSNGWICGNKGTFLQTKDGGKSWAAKSFANLDPDEEINYRFTKMSWINGEGWIIGKPAILLHSKDSGEHPPRCRRRRRRRCRRAAATAPLTPPLTRQPPVVTPPRSSPYHTPHLSRPSRQAARGSACLSLPSCPVTPSASSRLAQVRPACLGPGLGTRAKPSGVIALGGCRCGRALGPTHE